MSDSTFHFEQSGHCPICETEVTFSADDPWFRDHLVCSRCASIPRERALMSCVKQFFPKWRDLDIHESSPVGRGASLELARSPGYVATRYEPSMEPGERSVEGWIQEDLENQTFADGSFDLVVSQDVFEHVFDIDAAFREIARTLRPGGAHVFTTPLVRKAEPTQARARRGEDGSIDLLAPPEVHADPVDPRGSLVTWHFGFDLASRILEVAGMPTVIFSIDRLDLGMRAEFIEVLVSFRKKL